MYYNNIIKRSYLSQTDLKKVWCNAQDPHILQYWCPRAKKNKKWKSSDVGNRSYQLTSAGQSTNHGQICHHGLAGNSHFPRWRIFIFCFSEPLGINIEEYKGLVHCTRLFIQICFGVVWWVKAQKSRIDFWLNNLWVIEFSMLWK